MKLFTYWRSSAAYRVRIGLNLKKLAYESAFVDLLRDGGEHLKAPYSAINPMGVVPSLQLEDGTIVTQSMAILEYLEETHPEPAFLPGKPSERARVRALAQIVACDIHPVNNLRVTSYLTGRFGLDADAREAWMRHWIERGFLGLETLLTQRGETGAFCHGARPGLADMYLVPQVYNARRFKVDLTPYPAIRRIEAACLALDAFARAAPEAQGDARPGNV